MDLTIIQAALNIILSFFYIGCLYLVFKKGSIKDDITRVLVVYLSISTIWCLILTIGIFTRRDFLMSEWAVTITHYSIILLTIISLNLSYDKFGGGSIRPWFIFGAIWIGLYYFLNNSPISLDNIFQLDQSLAIAQQSLANVILIGGWTVIMVELVRYLMSLYQNSQQELLRNQISYWTLALISISVGDGLIFAEFILLGIILNWVGSLILTCVLLFEKLPEIRQLEQYILYYLVTTIVTASVLVLSIYVALPLFQDVGRENPTFTGAVLTLSIAAFLSLMWMLSARLVSRYIPLISNNPDRILHQYSQSISDVLDAERLGQIAVQLICDVFDIQYGYLFIVDFDIKQEGSVYILKSMNAGHKGKPLPGILAEESLFSNQLNKKRRILKQSDIDLYQRKYTMSKDEQNWLRELDADIYVPIHTRDEWIGLFALGPKNSDNPYFENEIRLLSIMADQTAVALNNARLVESLMRVNNDFRRAYKALEQSNAHLRRLNLSLENLERTKSGLINIASHELEAPLTLIRDYIEEMLAIKLIIEDPIQEKLSMGIYTELLHLEEIRNGLLDITDIDTRALQLQIEPTGINALTRLSVDNFSDIIDERNLTIKTENILDLPQVEADPVALQKVLYHLIANAIQYVPDGGKIRISGQNLPPGEMDFKSGGVHIIVEDNGVCIDPKFANMIFTEFSPVDEAKSPESEGVRNNLRGPGIGLAIAKGIVEAHRGKIWVESSNNDDQNGNEFHFALPLNYYDYPSTISLLHSEQIK